jgi:ADP-heptose:LPS heptosyltransferase
VCHRVDEGLPEIDRGLSLAAAAGFALPEGDDGRLAVRHPLPPVEHLVGDRPYVAIHPGVAAPAWRWPMERCAQTVHELTMRGRRAVVTGGPDEHALTILVAGRFAVNLGGRTSWAELAAVLAGASAVVACDTGPAHLAAAVGTPVVSPPNAESRAEEIADAVQRLVA